MKNVYKVMKVNLKIVEGENLITVMLCGNVTFLQLPSLISVFEKIDERKDVAVCAQGLYFMDHAGIDFLRIFAMFMIVVTHVLGKGGVRDSVAGTVDVHFLQTWIIQASVYVAVNCYALISGYVGFRFSFKYSKVVNLWLQVAFIRLG